MNSAVKMSCMLHRTESIFRQLAARRSDIIRQGQGSKCGAWGPICSVLRRPLIEGIEIGVAVVRHQPVASPQTNLRGFAHTPKQHRLVQKSFLVGIFTWSKNRTLPNRDQSINQSWDIVTDRAQISCPAQSRKLRAVAQVEVRNRIKGALRKRRLFLSFSLVSRACLG